MMKTTIVEAGAADRNYWKDAWEHRELLMFLAWRDLIVRYKQTIVGTSWFLFRPLLTLLAFTLVFGKIASLPSVGVPYPLLVFAGLLPWFFFAGLVGDCSMSILNNSAVVSKVYFPRIIVPLSALLVCFVDYLVSSLLIVVVILWTGSMPDSRIFTLPLLTLWVAALGFGIGLLSAALSARYRDTRHLIPFLLQLGIYMSPVGYTAQIVPKKWEFIYSLNPMVGIIDGYRWALLGSHYEIYEVGFLLSILFTILILLMGIRLFRKAEQSFVDYL